MPRDSTLWMWTQALHLLEQADRLQRRFCLPHPAAPAEPAWEPPVDVVETAGQFRITVVLPGVAPEDIELLTLDDTLVISGRRSPPRARDITVIHRLEIPYGRFERRIPLPPGRFIWDEPNIAHGCLHLVLNKCR